jgi:hypothetical protein
MSQISRPVKVDLHVGDDQIASDDLTCRCTVRDQENAVIEPIIVDRTGGEEGVEFRLMNPCYEFAGFISPQDKMHKLFDVEDINDKSGFSVMTVRDKCSAGASLFDYELVFRKTCEHDGGNLYHYDPQIKNK